MKNSLTPKQEKKLRRKLSTGQKELIRKRATSSALGWGVGSAALTAGSNLGQDNALPFAMKWGATLGTGIGVATAGYETARLKIQNRKPRESYSIADFYALANNKNKDALRKSYQAENARRQLRA